MTSDNKVPAKMASENNQNPHGVKSGYLKPPEQGLKCPRCDSPNTKFCYYNNYSLSQPRHFCKTCRRYWTSGGALRNVPIGGGCRKYKKIKSNSRQSSDSKDSPSSSSSETTSLKYFDGVSPPIEYQLGGINLFPRSLNSQIPGGGVYNHFPTAITTATSPNCFEMNPTVNPSLMGFTYLGPSSLKQSEMGSFNGRIQEMASMNFNTGLAPCIESLSYINQDLHWRLQQQRLAEMLNDQDNHQKESRVNVSSIPEATLENQLQKPEPILFQNLEISKPGATSVGNTTEWFFENPTYNQNATIATTINNEDEEEDTTTRNWSAGIQAWSDIHQYGSLP